MVSKLSFKGDKPKKKKIVKRTSKLEPSKPDIDPSLIESSWTTAITFSDLIGPVIITTYERGQQDFDHLNQQPLVLKPDILGDVHPKTELHIVDPSETVYFENDDDIIRHAAIHRTEPGDVQHVFVAVSVSFITSGSDVSPNRTKLAFKTASDKFLSLTGDGDVDCKSEAIGPYQIFELERVPITQEGVWFKIWNGKRKLVLKNTDGKLEYKFQDESEDNGTDLFVIRVQAKNSATGKRLLREYEESKTLGSDSLGGSIRKALDSLQKSGIEVNNATMKRLKDAAIKGKINEQLILERQKGKSDSRC